MLLRRRLAGVVALCGLSKKPPARRRRHEEPVSGDKIRIFHFAKLHRGSKCGLAEWREGDTACRK